MEASSRCLVLALRGSTMSQRQTHGDSSIMWRKENRESSCADMKSKPLERSGYKVAIFGGDAQPWIDAPQVFREMRNKRH